MWFYLLKRLLFMIPMLLGITIISFMVIHLVIAAVPGGREGGRIRVRPLSLAAETA